MKELKAPLAGTRAMSIEMVNGYLCRNCTDVDLAKRGVDPSKPKSDPLNPGYDPAGETRDKADPFGPAVRVSAAGDAPAGRDRPAWAGESPRPSPPQGQGRSLDLYA